MPKRARRIRSPLLRATTAFAVIAIAVSGVSASVSRAQTASVPNPVPPRMFLTPGFAGSNAYTLSTGSGYLAAGYPGADILAQVSNDGDVTSLPLIFHGAYGITDYLTLGLGSGFWRYEYEDLISETQFYPYLAPKLRLYDRERLTAGVRGVIVLPTDQDFDGYLYGASLELSSKITKEAAGHLSVGFAGLSIDGAGDYEAVLAVGGDVLAFMFDKGQIKLFGDFRRIAWDNGDTILTAGVRFLTSSSGAEAGFVRWFDEDFDLRPIVSVSYRF